MARRYRVAEGRTLVNGDQTWDGGAEVSLPELGELDAAALLQGGFLEEITPRVACPACEEDKSVKKADVPHFQKQETLTEHYASEHPALAAPDFEEVV